MASVSERLADVNPHSIWQQVPFKLHSSFSTSVGNLLNKIEQVKPFVKAVDLITPPRHKRPPPKAEDVSERNNKLRDKYYALMKRKDYPRWLTERAKLSVNKHFGKIRASLEISDVLVLGGSPACGKSTQLPLLILESAILKKQGAGCSILVVHPRRVTAVTCAEFAAKQLNETVGDEIIRVWEHPSDPLPEHGGYITYVTAGTLLEAFGQEGKVADVLDGLSHVIVDEVSSTCTQILNIFNEWYRANRCKKMMRQAIWLSGW